MRVTVVFDNSQDVDGVSSAGMLTRDVESVEDLLYIYSDAARAMGFTYVTASGFMYDDKEEVWERF